MFAFVNGIIAAAQNAGKVVNAVAKKAQNKDPGRIMTALLSLEKAKGGDPAARAYIDQQRFTSGSNLGKQAYQAAWTELNGGTPSITVAQLAQQYPTNEAGIAGDLENILAGMRERGEVESPTSVLPGNTVPVQIGTSPAVAASLAPSAPASNGMLLMLAVAAGVLFMVGGSNR